ncbi:MAG: hypothetical protein ACTSUE_18120 [Promethearchaeota archaeon]
MAIRYDNSVVLVDQVTAPRLFPTFMGNKGWYLGWVRIWSCRPPIPVRRVGVVIGGKYL